MAAVAVFVCTLIVLLHSLQFTTARAVPDRRLRNEGITTINSLQLTSGQTVHNIQFPRATELILDGFVVNHHWDESLFAKFNQTRFLTIIEGNIPEMTFRSTKLQSLSVVQTNLQTLEVWPEENRVLKTLQISRNKIRSLPENLRYLVAVSTLDLSQNELEYIDLSLFRSMSGLRILDLSVNRITAIDAPAWLKLGKLKHLWVSYNRLEKIEVFPGAFPVLDTVRLMGNLWTCRWVNRARKDIIDRKIVTYGVDYGCLEQRQGGLCCTGDLDEDDSTANQDVLKEGPLVEQIQKLANDLAEKPLNVTDGEQTLELLTQNKGKEGDKTLVGVKLDEVQVFF